MHEKGKGELIIEAGVGKGTLYEYFKSKKNLYEEMYRWYMEKYFNSLAKNIENEITAIDKIRIIIQNHLYHIQKAKGLFMILEADHNNKDLSPKIKQQLNDIYTNNHRQVKEIIDFGIQEGEFRKMDANLAANFLLSSIAGLGHSMMFLEIDHDHKEIADGVLDLFVNGMKNLG